MEDCAISDVSKGDDQIEFSRCTFPLTVGTRVQVHVDAVGWVAGVVVSPEWAGYVTVEIPTKSGDQMRKHVLPSKAFVVDESDPCSWQKESRGSVASSLEDNALDRERLRIRGSPKSSASASASSASSASRNENSTCGKTLHPHSENITFSKTPKESDPDGIKGIFRDMAATSELPPARDVHASPTPPCIAAQAESLERIIHTQVTEDLLSKGFSVRQLLHFHARVKKKFGMDFLLRCTTEEVARDVVIPETEQTPDLCYMDASFMKTHGGRHAARKLVSHAWKCSFHCTVSNILCNAADMDQEALKSVGNFRRGRILALELLPKLSDQILEMTYWLDMFAINQHRAICGDCWACRDEGTAKRKKGEVLTSEELRMPKCIHGRKRNPCKCGTRKFDKKHPRREVPRIVDVLSRTKELTVSLDEKLLTLTRLWVIKEIAHAVRRGVEVKFIIPAALSAESNQRLLNGDVLLPSFRDLEVAEADHEDKCMIMRLVESQPGGVSSFDRFIQCMIEMQFGCMSRLGGISEIAEEAISKLRCLSIDFSWARAHLTSVSKLGGPAAFSDGFKKLYQLQQLHMNFSGCSQLADVNALGNGVAKLQQLQQLHMNFSDCSQLADVNALGNGVAKLQQLQQLHMYFAFCSQLADVNALGNGVAKLQQLQQLHMNFSGCSQLADVNALGNGVAKLQQLQQRHKDWIIRK